VPFDYKNNERLKLVNRRSVSQVLKHVPERQINKLMLAFDEVPITYACPQETEADDDDGQVTTYKPMAPVPFNCENFSTFVGVTKYVEAGMRNIAD